MTKAYRWSGLMAALALTLTLLPAAGAAQANAPEVSSNRGAHEYVNGRRWARPVRSYLYENQLGGLTRVEYVEDRVVVEDYDEIFCLRSKRTIQPELPLWGGFFSGADYYYLIYGQNNEEEDDDAEVIRIVQYDKDWNRLGQASLSGANTVEPFASGSLRCAEYGGYLYIRTCHRMYASGKDGLNHQANLMLALRQRDLEITDSYCEVMNADYGYVSHSFNQFVLVDREGRIVTLDHGDAGQTRSVILLRYRQKAGQDSFRDGSWTAVGDGRYGTKWADGTDLQAFPEAAVHYNDTGCGLGGFAETSKGYAAAYQFDGTASELGEDKRDVYLVFADKELNAGVPVKLNTGRADVSNPQLVSTGLNGGYVLWNTVERESWRSSAVGDKLYYAAYNAQGRAGGVQTADSAPLSDCQPIAWNGKVAWYTTEDSAPVFYLLDSEGVTAAQPSCPETAHAAVQTVLVDGKEVEFQAYALWDENGSPTNYVKLRDLAYVLNGTPAQFRVTWRNRVVVNTKRDYTPTGEEMNAPYTGDQSCIAAVDRAWIDGKAVPLDAFTIYDEEGGGHTYYKLRDLGEVLGFTVDWSPEAGVSIRTAQ